MNRQSSLIRKYEQLFSPEHPYETFLDFLEALNANDWFSLLSSALRDGDEVAYQIIAPPPGQDCILYLSVLLRQASQRTCELAGVATAEHIRMFANSLQQASQLRRLLVLAQTLGSATQPSALEDIMHAVDLPHRIRLKAGMALAESWPERLLPSQLDITRSAAYLPAIVAAARTADVRWLNMLFSGPVPRPHCLSALRSPLRLALKKYSKLFGEEILLDLYMDISQSRWLVQFLEDLFSQFSDLSFENYIFSQVVTGRPLGKGGRVEDIKFDIRSLRERTMQMREDPWSDIDEDQFSERLSQIDDLRSFPFLDQSWSNANRPMTTQYTA
jgi:hypothetical protein